MVEPTISWNNDIKWPYFVPMKWMFVQVVQLLSSWHICMDHLKYINSRCRKCIKFVCLKYINNPVVSVSTKIWSCKCINGICSMKHTNNFIMLEMYQLSMFDVRYERNLLGGVWRSIFLLLDDMSWHDIYHVKAWCCGYHDMSSVRSHSSLFTYQQL